MEEYKISDIYYLETLLKGKIQELQWKAEALDRMNVDLNQNRQMLYDERMLLDKERRQVKELELQLKSSQERIECLEKDKQKYQQEKIKLQVNCDTAVKERDSLLNQAQNANIENLQLLIKVQHLEEKILKKETFTDAIGISLEQFKNEMTRHAQNLNRDILKLKQEQDCLRHSMKITEKLNQRLAVMGMCVHHHDREQKETIKHFQTKLNEFSMKDVEQLNEVENIIKFPKMQVILDVTNESDSDEDLDKQMEAFIQELRNTDGE